MLWCYDAMMLCLSSDPAFHSIHNSHTSTNKGTKAHRHKAQKYKKAKVKMEKAKAVIAFWQRGALNKNIILIRIAQCYS